MQPDSGGAFAVVEVQKAPGGPLIASDEILVAKRCGTRVPPASPVGFRASTSRSSPWQAMGYYELLLTARS